MSELRNFFENNSGNAIHKWIHYFEIYEFWFKKYKDKPVVILEIGVYQGGSLKMWREYFGEDAKIYAIDINPSCKQFESDNTQIFIGSQDDRIFLNSVKSQIPEVDILIDDGGHTMNQQIVSFEELFDHIKEDGIYLCEDLHTSYWKTYGGGLKKSESFIEYSKNFIDSLNAWHSEENNFKVDKITLSAHSLHYYDSILVIKKRKIKAPNAKILGEIVIPIEEFPAPHRTSKNKSLSFSKLKNRIKNIFFRKKIKLKKGFTSKNNQIKRFVPTTIKYLGRNLHVHDIDSFHLCDKELFKSQMYKFESKDPKPLIIDCGSNIGMSIIYFKKLYPYAEIIGFEADDHIFNFLKRNMESYNFKDVKIINKAVYNRVGELSFYDEGGAGGRIEVDDKVKPYKKVNSVRLRSYLENRKIHFLKLDIEGAEYEVLKDCEDLLFNVENIFVEYHSFPGRKQNLQEILSMLSLTGFKYHIKEAYTTDLPYIERKLNVGMDLQLNIFGYRNFKGVAE